MQKRALKRLFKGEKIFFIWLLLGVMVGVIVGILEKDLPDRAFFAGGFAHGLPGSFSLKDLFEALAFQALPLFLIFYGGFGVLCVKTACASLLFRGIPGGYVFALAVRLTDVSRGTAVLLLVLFAVFEGLTLCLHLSFAHLARAFSHVILKKKSRKATKRFTLDFLFFYGLILFFYLARGSIVAMMNS